MTEEQLQEIAVWLDEKADEMNDSHDHDELHAASTILRIFGDDISEFHYVERWIQGLVKLHG